MTPDSMRRLVNHAALLCGAALFHAVPPSANASQTAGQWWDGAWRCTIDGRPARMRWASVDDTDTDCRGDICSSTLGVTRIGSFSDNGSRWVSLKDGRTGDKGGLFFRHSDGNRWYLAKPNGAGKAVGWTTWQQRRHPLVCSR